MKNINTLRRLYKDYTKKYLKKIIFSVFLSIIVAGSTASIAWLLDPAIEENFHRKGSNFNSYNSNFNNYCIYNKRSFSLFCKNHNGRCGGGSQKRCPV